MPTVTVLLRTLNAGDYLGPLLESLSNQTLKPVEVLVVDSESTDGTPESARDAGARTVTIKRSEFTHAKSTNLGFSESRGEIVAMLSQDALPANSRWLESLVVPLGAPAAAGVFGRQIPRPACFAVERWELERAYPASGKAGVTYSNVNSAAKKSVWQSIPFDESVTISEDRFWAEKIKSRGLEIIYRPQAEVWHSHNYSLRQVYRRCREESSAKLAVEGDRQGWGLLWRGWPKQVFRDASRLHAEGRLGLLPRTAAYRWFQFSGLVAGGRG